MAAKKTRRVASDEENPGKRGVSQRGLTARRKLIAAAYEVMSQKGLEGSTIAEIIAEAGVGVGSFYNHFTSKEELAQAVFSNRANEFGAALEQVVRRAPNAAAATCYAYRRLIEESERDKVWASFIVQLEPTMQMLDNMLRKYARVGLGIGVEEGLLHIYNIEAGITAIHALEVAIVKSMLQGHISHKEAHQSAVEPVNGGLATRTQDVVSRSTCRRTGRRGTSGEYRHRHNGPQSAAQLILPARHSGRRRPRRPRQWPPTSCRANGPRLTNHSIGASRNGSPNLVAKPARPVRCIGLVS